MQSSARRATLLVVALSFAGAPAFAQDSERTAPLTAEENALLANALIFDAATLALPSNRPLRIPGAKSKDFDVARTRKPDGSTTVVIKQPLHADWPNTVGADSPPSTGMDIDSPFPTTASPGSAGTAWASLGVPYVGTVDAGVDPANEQGKIGTTFKQSIPFGQRFAVTVQDTYSVTDTIGRPSATTSDLPLIVSQSTAPTALQVYGNERAVKFNILPTGTTLGAGLMTASNDPTTHNNFSADQKLYGPLHVTTAVTDVGQTTSSKSVTAGFKFDW